MKYFKRILFIFFILVYANASYACRFWVGTGDNFNRNVTEHLIKQPHAMKKLGVEYRDGWSVGYYLDGQPKVWRSDKAAHKDDEFDIAVNQSLRIQPVIMFSHLRRASSGCVEGVPNPHPFTIEENGKVWLFGHNGGMKKQILIDLIGKEYLENNAPVICKENPPDSWIDSELFFIFLIKSIKEHNWDVVKGIRYGLNAIYHVIDEENRYLNFFLTDGETVWAYRKGNSLFYQFDDKTQKSFISSTVPYEDRGTWKEFPEYSLATMRPGQTIKILEIADNVSIH